MKEHTVTVHLITISRDELNALIDERVAQWVAANTEDCTTSDGPNMTRQDWEAKRARTGEKRTSPQPPPPPPPAPSNVRINEATQRPVPVIGGSNV